MYSLDAATSRTMIRSSSGVKKEWLSFFSSQRLRSNGMRRSIQLQEEEEEEEEESAGKPWAQEGTYKQEGQVEVRMKGMGLRCRCG